MGAGKTTLGRALQCACPGFGVSPRRYIDLDDYIEEREAMTVREIFALRGEAAFRAMEADALRQLGTQEGVIIGCGGGTPCHSGNMEWMNAAGVTVLLEAPHAVLLRRLIEGQAQRPLLAGKSPVELSEFIAAKVAERMPHYSQAQLRFPSADLETTEGINRSIAAFWQMIQQEGEEIVL